MGENSRHEIARSELAYAWRFWTAFAFACPARVSLDRALPVAAGANHRWRLNRCHYVAAWMGFPLAFHIAERIDFA
jgi:hypothetical protein